jgi:MHS family alpha-ketoglutarate permease-like MFS transporter
MQTSVDSSAAGAPAGVNGRVRTLVGGSIGHFIEWFDWAIYGLMAGVIAAQMFPASDPAVSLIASLSAFAIGFIGRPIGAIILSPMADKYGRRTLLAATIIMAGIGSFVIGIMPNYEQIGILAPILIVCARLLQGLAGGAEYQISATFLNEHASVKNRAFNASPQQIAIGLSVLAATGVATATTTFFTPETLEAWGWRVPYLLGAAMSVYGFFIRRGLDETPAFEANAKKMANRSLGSILAAVAKYPKETFIVFVLQMNGVMYYLWLIFLPTYANMIGGLSRSEGFAGNMISTIVYIFGVPTFAYISDRIGRKPLLFATAILFLLFVYPLLSLLNGQVSFWTFTFVSAVGALFLSMNNGVLGTVLSELFPTEVRTSGIGIPYAICAALFGGTAPLVATWLHGQGGVLYVSLYAMLICVISILTHFFLTPETRGRSLD